MALIDVALAENSVVYVDTTVPQDENSLISLGVLSADTVVYQGGGSIDLTSILGADALKSSNVVATDGTTVNIDAGLLDVSLLSQTNLLIDGDSSITMDAGAISALSGVTDLLNNTTVAFSGSGDGTFTYNPPTVGLLSTTSIEVAEMGPGDEVVIPYAGDGVLGGKVLREDKGSLGTQPAYRDGYLHLKNGSGGLSDQTKVKIKMTQDEYDAYEADKGAWLKGGEDKFIFPGNDDDEPPYDVPCFTVGTMIETPDGLRVIEDLKPGDLVLTRDNGAQPLCWIGMRRLDSIDLRLHANLRPVRIKAAALGSNMPEKDLVVSPQHRVLVRSRIAEKMFGQFEVLVAAKQLLQLDGVELDEDLDEITYVHMLFDQHEIVMANGTAAESLYLGPMALEAVSPAAMSEIRAIFPELLEDEFEPTSARLLASGRKGRRLAVRHLQNRKPIYTQ